MFLKQLFDFLGVNKVRVDLSLCYAAWTPENKTENMTSADPALLVRVKQHFPTT
jgi:hypothetical protein